VRVPALNIKGVRSDGQSNPRELRSIVLHHLFLHALILEKADFGQPVGRGAVGLIEGDGGEDLAHRFKVRHHHGTHVNRRDPFDIGLPGIPIAEEDKGFGTRLGIVNRRGGFDVQGADRGLRIFHGGSHTFAVFQGREQMSPHVFDLFRDFWHASENWHIICFIDSTEPAQQLREPDQSRTRRGRSQCGFI